MEDMESMSNYIQIFLPENLPEPGLTIAGQAVAAWFIVGRQSALGISKIAVKNIENNRTIAIKNGMLDYIEKSDGCFVLWFLRAVIAACGIEVPPINELRFLNILSTL